MANKLFFKFNLTTFLVVFLLSSSTIYTQEVSATSTSIYPNLIYRSAWQIIDEKFYFKSRVNLDPWKDKFKNKINSLDDAHKYINKLIQELNDPYTRFLTQEEFKEEEDIMNSTLVGIGIKLGGEKPIILDVLPKSPAEKASIKPNDYILSINNKPTKGLSIKQIAALVRGPAGTAVTIKAKRGNDAYTTIVNREEFQFNTVTSTLLDNNVVLLKIGSFIPEDTSKRVKEELKKYPSAKGLILDLRNNSGGLLHNAVEIADMFLSKGKIVSTSNHTFIKNEFANSSQIFDLPMVVLVNKYSASASEIVTSALKENNRAHVIGERTFGKGLVQEIIKLPDDSALHVTIAVYLTPDGNYINKKGIIPDEVIYNSQKQLEKATEILRV